MPEIGKKSPWKSEPFDLSEKSRGPVWGMSVYPFQGISLPRCRVYCYIWSFLPQRKTQSLVSLLVFNVYLIWPWSCYSSPFTQWSERFPIFVCSQTRGGSSIGPGCHAGTHRHGWCLNVLWHPSSNGGGLSETALQQVLEALVCSMRNNVPYAHHVAFSLSQPTHMASFIAHASLHQSVGPCQFGMAFYTWVLMADSGGQSTLRGLQLPSLFFFYQSWVCQWIYIFPESKG